MTHTGLTPTFVPVEDFDELNALPGSTVVVDAWQDTYRKHAQGPHWTYTGEHEDDFYTAKAIGFPCWKVVWA